MDTTPKIVSQNPYRILGVYANAAKKDIVAYKGKATAFLKVNKSVEFPLDLKGLLPEPIRTLDLMNEAEAHLAIAKEQIKYAQFWFLKMTPLDDIAFNHLLAGNIDVAKEIWSKQESLSSLQNRLVCFLIEHKPELAVKIAEKLYGKYGNEYISKIDANCTLLMSATDLLHQFFDSLGEEIGIQELLGYKLGGETKAYITKRAIDPLISNISAEVDRTKRADHKDPKARITAARNLVRRTKDPFSQLKGILPATDSQYQMIADKLGLEILQCGIDFFLGMKDQDDDAPHTAMKMLKYARSVVVGSMAVQRCNDQISELQKYIDRLPPVIVKEEYEHLMHQIALFVVFPSSVDGVLGFLKSTRADLVSMKAKLGKENSFYLQQATQVAQVALGKSVDALNEVQEKEFPRLNGLNRAEVAKTISHAFAKSWETILWIELIDTTTEFKVERLNPNKEALKKILDDIDAFKRPRWSHSIFSGCAINVNVDKYTYFTEAEMYGECKNIDCCNIYIEKFPDGEHIKTVRRKLLQLQDDKSFSEAESITDYEAYIESYPGGRHVEEAKSKIRQFEEKKRKMIENELFELVGKVNYCRSVEQCVALLDTAKKYKSEKLDRQIDDKFYSLCSSSDDYNLYIDRMEDTGRHVEEAEQRLCEISRNKRVDIAILSQALCVLIAYVAYYYNDIIDVNHKWYYLIGGFSVGSFSWLILLGQRKVTKWNVFSVIAGVLMMLVSSYFLFLYRVNTQKKEYQERMENRYDALIMSSDIDSGLAFLSDYPNSGKEKQKALMAMVNKGLKMKADSLIAVGDIQSLKAFQMKYSSNERLSGKSYMKNVEKKVASLEREQRRIAEERRIQQQKEQEERRKQEEYERYGTDAKAWKTASEHKTISAYEEYIARYPKGKHVNEANKRIIDLEVQAVRNSGDYGHLPPSQKMGYGTSSTSNIRLKNSSSSTITIMYSGVQSMKIVLSPHQSRTISLPSGNYQVVATAPGVRSFYGTENLTGGGYEAEYYITTSRY